jgi:hypothetical protein
MGRRNKAHAPTTETPTARTNVPISAKKISDEVKQERNAYERRQKSMLRELIITCVTAGNEKKCTVRANKFNNSTDSSAAFPAFNRAFIMDVKKQILICYEEVKLRLIEENPTLGEENHRFFFTLIDVTASTYDEEEIETYYCSYLVESRTVVPEQIIDDTTTSMNYDKFFTCR